jgi:hypothetical protein
MQCRNALGAAEKACWHAECIPDQWRTSTVSMTPSELPLTFAGHVARIVISSLPDGGWNVCAEVDGRTVGWEQYSNWTQVERFHARMQNWVTAAEAAEQRLTSAA